MRFDKVETDFLAPFTILPDHPKSMFGIAPVSLPGSSSFYLEGYGQFPAVIWFPRAIDIFQSGTSFQTNPIGSWHGAAAVPEPGALLLVAAGPAVLPSN